MPLYHNTISKIFIFIIILLSSILTSCSSVKKNYYHGKFYSASDFDKHLYQKEVVVEKNYQMCLQKDYGESIDEMIAKLKSAQDFKVLHTLALCYYLEDKIPAKSEFYFRLALLATNNNNFKAIIHNNLAILFQENKARELAHFHFEKAKSLSSDDIIWKNFINSQLVLYPIYLNASDEARLAKIGAKDISAKIILANIYFYQANYSKAVKVFDGIDFNLIAENKSMSNFLWSLFHLNQTQKFLEIYNNYENQIDDKEVFEKVMRNGRKNSPAS